MFKIIFIFLELIHILFNFIFKHYLLFIELNLFILFYPLYVIILYFFEY
jgi:hypothetical protein